MTSSYQKGYQAELDLVRRLKRRKEFHTVIRSAGSRSAFDVAAIGKHRILLCQVKSGKGKFKDERKKLRHLKVPRCAKKLFKIYRKGKWNTISIK